MPPPANQPSSPSAPPPARAAAPVARAVLSAEQLLQVQAELLGRKHFDEAATALAQQLASSLKCNRASIGWKEKSGIRVIAASYVAEVHTRQETSRLMAAAMEEAVAQGVRLVHPEPEGVRPNILLAHEELARRQGYAICTVPLVYGGDIVGALTMERRDREFSPAEATHIERIAAMLAPSLALKYEIGLSPWRRCRTQFRAAVGKRLRSDTPASRPLRIGLGVAGAALAALLLIPTPHSVTAPARLEGAMQRVLTAPADGYLQKVYVRPGDRVRSGQILAELADQDMAVELRGLEAELAQHENALISAQARNDSAEYSASQGRYLAARARHDLVRQQIERTHLRAPFDGVVIKGDLNQTVGAPVERGAELITLAPDTGYRVLLEAEEAEIADLREGQAGQLKLAAMPSLAIPLRIERITPLASTEQGRHYFAVYASLQGKLPSLRPGMQGFARIEIDSRSMLFDALRRAFDRARLMIWSWGA